MKHYLKKLYHWSRCYLLDVRRSNQLTLVWIGFIVGYITIREIIGLHTVGMYFYLVLLLICRFSFLRISLTFFIIALDAFLASQFVEANNYMSYVFIFLILSLLKQYYLLFIKRK